MSQTSTPASNNSGEVFTDQEIFHKALIMVTGVEDLQLFHALTTRLFDTELVSENVRDFILFQSRRVLKTDDVLFFNCRFEDENADHREDTPVTDFYRYVGYLTMRNHGFEWWSQIREIHQARNIPEYEMNEQREVFLDALAGTDEAAKLFSLRLPTNDEEETHSDVEEGPVASMTLGDDDAGSSVEHLRFGYDRFDVNILCSVTPRRRSSHLVSRDRSATPRPEAMDDPMGTYKGPFHQLAELQRRRDTYRPRYPPVPLISGEEHGSRSHHKRPVPDSVFPPPVRQRRWESPGLGATLRPQTFPSGEATPRAGRTPLSPSPMIRRPSPPLEASRSASIASDDLDPAERRLRSLETQVMSMSMGPRSLGMQAMTPLMMATTPAPAFQPFHPNPMRAPPQPMILLPIHPVYTMPSPMPNRRFTSPTPDAESRQSSSPMPNRRFTSATPDVWSYRSSSAMPKSRATSRAPSLAPRGSEAKNPGRSRARREAKRK